MTEKKKYLFLIFAIVLISGYLVATEITQRWQQSLRFYSDTVRKEETILNPEALLEKKVGLLARRRELVSLLAPESKEYEQTQTGVFEFLNASAKQSQFQFQSIVPIELRGVGNTKVKEIGFKIEFLTSFHKACKFFNTIETGSLLVQITRASMHPLTTGKPLLRVTAEGTAFTLPR